MAGRAWQGGSAAALALGWGRWDCANKPAAGAPFRQQGLSFAASHPRERGVPAQLHGRGIGWWTEADFGRLLAAGVRPDRRMVDTAHMPVQMTRAMTDVERRALWAYLRTVPAREGRRAAVR